MKRLALVLPIALLFAASCQKDADKNFMGPAPAPKADVASPETPSGPPPIILTTDKSDYLPGETVIIIGHGWKPGSTISMLLEEDPTTHDPRTFSAVVDANGDFSNSEFVVEEHDLGVLFKLTVTGDGEGGMAFFTDGGPPPAGTTLSASKTATAHYTRTFDWTIDKSVDPSNWDLFRGDAGTSEYAITVVKDGGTDAAWLDGQICVTNGGAVATNGLQIVDNLTMPPSHTVIASLNVDVSSNPVLDPGETGCYSYHVDIPSSDVNAGDTYKNTADVTITNHSGHSGEPFGPQASASVILQASPTLINNSINVDDSNGDSYAFSASGSETYSATFTCDEDAGTPNNTATIRETGQSNGASVTVACYALEVTKTASTTYDRTYDWSVAKSGDKSALTLALNESYLVNYTVVVSETYTDGNWAASGSIAVKNPAPIDATINSVSDVVSTAISASPSCSVTFPYTLPAGETLSCTYTTSLPDATSRTNTGTGTLQNNSYDESNVATASGTTDFSGTAAVTFGDPTNEIDQCVTATDDHYGSLGAVCAADAPKTYTYSGTIGPYTTCGNYTVDNTAAYASETSSAAGSDNWTVNVNVPCSGCTLTIGYWKTHNGLSSSLGLRDMVTTLLPISLGSGGGKTVTVTTATQATSILNKDGDASNGINKLYAQLLGAKLNIKNGASGAAVASVISAADAFLVNKNAADWNSLSKSNKNLVLSWVIALDNYNNGLTGPGHCSQ